MYPHERSLVKRMENKPFNLIGINSDPKEHIQKRMVEEKITWPFFWDGGSTDGPIANAWNVKSWPTIYVLDSKGVIRFKNVRGKQLDEAVDSLLKEMGVTVEPSQEKEE